MRATLRSHCFLWVKNANLIFAELMATSQRPVIPVAEVASGLIERYGAEYDRPITNRWVGGVLRKRLNIHTYKSHGVYAVPMNERSKIELLCRRSYEPAGAFGAGIESW